MAIDVDKILKLMKGDEPQEFYEGIAKEHTKPREKLKDVSTLGTRENPVSISSLPKLMGCQKRAVYSLTQENISEDEKIIKGNYADDCIFFSLKGVPDAPLKKFLGVAYHQLTPKKQETIWVKCQKLSALIKNNVFGAPQLQYMQTPLLFEYHGIWFRGHVDLVTLHRGALFIFDIKFSGKKALENVTYYFLQLFGYKVGVEQLLLSSSELHEGTTPRVEIGGVINPNKGILKKDENTKENLVAVINSSLTLTDVCERVREIQTADEHRATMSYDCTWCNLCFSDPKETHFSELTQTSQVKDVVERIGEVQQEKQVQEVMSHVKNLSHLPRIGESKNVSNTETKRASSSNEQKREKGVQEKNSQSATIRQQVSKPISIRSDNNSADTPQEKQQTEQESQEKVTEKKASSETSATTDTSKAKKSKHTAKENKGDIVRDLLEDIELDLTQGEIDDVDVAFVAWDV